MKGLIVETDHRLRIGDIAEPTPGPFDALVKIKACGICSTTDTEIIRGTQPYHKAYPCLLGHEAVGEVVRVGDKVTKFRVGDLVTRPVGMWPGSSANGITSGWGGFAEIGFVRDATAMAAAGDPSLKEDYTAVRQNVVPGGIDVRAAVLAIALAETLSWSRHVPNLAGANVCVSGTGIAGLSIIMWARLLGAKKIVVLGRRDSRLTLARELGADFGVNVKTQDVAKTVREFIGGGVDLFLEAAGAPDQIKVGCSVIRAGGTIAVYGVAPNGKYDLDWSWLPGDVRIMTPPAEEHITYAEVAQMIAAGKIPVAKLMSHRWPLAKFSDAFGAIERGEVVKGMLDI